MNNAIFHTIKQPIESIKMKNHRHIVAIALLLVAAMLLLTGCHAWHGLGEDIEGTGDSMQDK